MAIVKMNKFTLLSFDSQKEKLLEELQSLSQVELINLQDENFIVIYHNCGDNVPVMLDSILSTGSAAYHFGNSVDLEKDIILKVSSDVVIMGNIDPAGVLRMGTPESVRNKTLELLEKCSKYSNFVLSSGCDIPPMTPWENIDAFFKAAEEFYN